MDRQTDFVPIACRFLHFPACLINPHALGLGYQSTCVGLSLRVVLDYGENHLNPHQHYCAYTLGYTGSSNQMSDQAVAYLYRPAAGTCRIKHPSLSKNCGQEYMVPEPLPVSGDRSCVACMGELDTGARHDTKQRANASAQCTHFLPPPSLRSACAAQVPTGVSSFVT